MKSPKLIPQHSASGHKLKAVPLSVTSLRWFCTFLGGVRVHLARYLLKQNRKVMKGFHSDHDSFHMMFENGLFVLGLGQIQ